MTVHAHPRRALAVAAIVVASSLVGCAKYDGDQAAFCIALPDAPSYTSLALATLSGTADAAADRLDDAASSFRSLERSAPRGIRIKVSALGDSAERLANRFRRDQPPPVGPNDFDGLLSDDPYRYVPRWNTRQGMFSQEVMDHPSVVDAASSLERYARETCEIEEPTDLIGVYGAYAYDNRPMILDGGVFTEDPGIDPGSSTEGGAVSTTPEPSPVMPTSIPAGPMPNP